MNEKEKRKILISSIIIIITLILVVVGTTYAFFSLQIEGENITTNVELTAGEQNEITLSGGITNYHINLDVSDMTEDKIWTPYYGTTDSSKKYETEWDLALQDIGTLTKKGTLTEKYICSADININLDGDMQDFLQTNDLVLVVKQESASNTYDLSNVSNKNTFRFKLDNDSINPIKAYLKFTNQESDQSDLAGTSLNISINIDNFACKVSVGKEPLEMLREHATGGEEAVTFTEEDVDGMYRYKGTKDEVTNNYICFGTDNTETCLDTPEDYMYRIIGITDKEDNTINLPANSLKLIIASSKVGTRGWNSLQNQSDCEADGIENDKCTWDDSSLKTYLNGTNSNQFLGAVKWETPAYWKGLITSQKWYNVDQQRLQTSAKEPTDSTTTSSYQVGLMYVQDFMNAGEESTNNWLLIANGWAGNANNDEWTMSRRGGDGYYLNAYSVTSSGKIKYNTIGATLYIRPVFYVSPIITLTGEGTAENPFIIHS